MLSRGVHVFIIFISTTIFRFLWSTPDSKVQSHTHPPRSRNSNLGDSSLEAVAQVGSWEFFLKKTFLMSRSLRKNWRICRNRKPTQELGARQGQEGSSGGAEERTSLSWKTSTASGATSATFPGLYRREGDGDICAYGTFASFLPQLGLSPKDGSVPFLFYGKTFSGNGQ